MDRMDEREDAIYEFFRHLDRSFFIDNENKPYASYDLPLAIGYGQTISQPTLVLEMTWQLELNKDCRVLEIGTGSGYQTAFLAEFAGEVYSIERIAELADKARQRLTALGYSNICFLTGDGSQGWPDHAPYDRIIATAGALTVPTELLAQLAPGGIMIIPVGEPGHQKLLRLEKDENGQIDQQTLGWVRFVELKGKYGWH